MELLERVFTRKWLKVLRYITVITVVLIISFGPLQLAGQASSSVDIQSLIPKPSQSNGQEVFHAIYRGVKENDLPQIADQIADPVYQKYLTMDDIYNGLAYLQNVTALNPDRASLLSVYLGNNTIQKFVQTVFSARSNTTDLWWAVT